MIDIHCHILANVDDGSDSIEESIEMARQAAADGITAIVATPHTLNGIYSNSMRETNIHCKELSHLLRKNQIEIKIYAGLEVHLCAKMTEKVVSEQVTLCNNGRYVLLELPSQTIPSGFKNELFKLRLAGITPIIAHPERNLVLQHEIKIVYELVEMGCLMQLTAMSITGEFGEQPMDCARRLLELRLVHIIASDAHSAKTRPPILSFGMEAAADILKNEDEAKNMVMSTPQKILDGKIVEVSEPIRRRKKKWWFWGKKQ